MKKSHYALFIILITILFNCSKNSKSPNEALNTDKIIPLVIGNNWIYAPFNSSGDTSKVTISGQMTITYKGSEIEVYTSIGGELSNGIWDDEPDKRLIQVESDGFYEYGELDINDSLKYGPLEKKLIAKYPVNVGDKWSYIAWYWNWNINDNDTTTVRVECISTNEILNTSAGNFDCIVYRYTRDSYGQGGYYDVYYSLIYGRIGSHADIPQDNYEKWSLLISHNLNN